MANAATAHDSDSGSSLSASPEQENAQEVITRPILEAIDASKVTVLVSIDHLTTECTLIRHELDNIRGRHTVAEDRISEGGDVSHSQDTQLSELQDMVKMLQNRADDAEDRQRRNNVRVVELPEGAKGTQPTTFAEQFFKQLLELGELPPTFVVEWAHRVPHRQMSLWCVPSSVPSQIPELQGPQHDFSSIKETPGSEV